MAIDWGNALDFSQAGANLRIEQIGDWHQDPWGWPEIEYALRRHPVAITDVCRASGARQAALINIPKENWGTRPAVVLDIMDRLVYQALVDRVSIDLVGEMSSNAFGWRLPAIDPKRGVYSPNKTQWDSYRRHLSLLAALHGVALKTDLVSFFASIPIPSVQEAIQDKTSKGDIANRLCDLLAGFDATPSRSGLPQRSWASAIIANMYVGPLDDALTHHSSPMPIFMDSKLAYHTYARWMDDMWLFGGDAAAMRKAQVDLQEVAESIGLNLNASKTDVLEGDEVAQQALEIEHSAVDDAIDKKDDFRPLEELIDRLLNKPEKASRTSAKFAARRMRDHNNKYRLQELVQAAERMPHAADAWSRLFKNEFTQESLEDWFLHFAESDWSTHKWSVAQIGRMFESERVPLQSLIDYFAGTVRDANTPLPLLAVSAQRLASWDAAEARSAFRDAHVRASTPHARRILALAALSAGERRTTVRRWLSVDIENAVTRHMLEGSGYAPLKVEADFAR